MKISIDLDSDDNIQVINEDEKLQLIQVSFFNQASNISVNKKVEAVVALLEIFGFKPDDFDF